MQRFSLPCSNRRVAEGAKWYDRREDYTRTVHVDQNGGHLQLWQA